MIALYGDLAEMGPEMLGCAADQQINHQILRGHSRTLSMREGAASLWLGADDRFRGIRHGFSFHSQKAQSLQNHY